MASHLSRYEQETLVSFNEEEETATIITANGAWKRKLKELAAARPEEVIETPWQEPFASFTVPKTWIRVNPSRVLSEKQKAASLKAVECALQARGIFK